MGEKKKPQKNPASHPNMDTFSSQGFLLFVLQQITFFFFFTTALNEQLN